MHKLANTRNICKELNFVICLENASFKFANFQTILDEYRLVAVTVQLMDPCHINIFQENSCAFPKHNFK